MLKAEEGNMEEVRRIITELKNIDINAINKKGYTSLALAVKAGHFEIVKLLISLGGDPNIKNNVYFYLIESYFYLNSLDKAPYSWLVGTTMKIWLSYSLLTESKSMLLIMYLDILFIDLIFKREAGLL